MDAILQALLFVWIALKGFTHVCLYFVQNLIFCTVVGWCLEYGINSNQFLALGHVIENWNHISVILTLCMQRGSLSTLLVLRRDEGLMVSLHMESSTIASKCHVISKASLLIWDYLCSFEIIARDTYKRSPLPIVLHVK